MRVAGFLGSGEVGAAQALEGRAHLALFEQCPTRPVVALFRARGGCSHRQGSPAELGLSESPRRSLSAAAARA